MAELTLTTFISLDGVMQGPGSPAEDPDGGFQNGGWVVPYFDADSGKIIDDIYTKADAFLFGRKTYDIFSAHWPKVTEPDNQVARKLNSLPKFVASQTRKTFSWNDTSPIRNVVKDIPDIKQRFSNEVQVHGSCGLAQTLIENDLIDEFRLLTYPVILGNGKRLFGAGAVPSSLKHVTSKTTGSGVVMSVYRRSGSLITGSVETP